MCHACSHYLIMLSVLSGCSASVLCNMIEPLNCHIPNKVFDNLSHTPTHQPGHVIREAYCGGLSLIPCQLLRSFLLEFGRWWSLVWWSCSYRSIRQRTISTESETESVQYVTWQKHHDTCHSSKTHSTMQALSNTQWHWLITPSGWCVPIGSC